MIVSRFVLKFIKGISVTQVSSYNSGWQRHRLCRKCGGGDDSCFENDLEEQSKDANLKITVNSELVEISDDQELRNLFQTHRPSLV